MRQCIQKMKLTKAETPQGKFAVIFLTYLPVKM